MRITVLGLGYVGAVTAACLADLGHEVTGVDVNPTKVEDISRGESPVAERGLRDLIRKGLESGRLRATTNGVEAVRESDVSIICVGTPSDRRGGQNLEYVGNVAKQIGIALGKSDHYHVVVVRSTVFPGTTERLVIPALEVFSGKEAGPDFGVCMNPEFLREGSAIDDFYAPARTVIGQLDTRSGDVLAELYKPIDAPIVRTEIRVAEMIKYTDNAFHALKVSFANEIGRLCQALGIDSHEVMDIFAMDRKLNLSPYYLKPGYAFGGSCLPKDVRALITEGRRRDVPLPLLEAVLESNEKQMQIGLERVMATGKRKVGILGMSFKPGTDDLRESPVARLVRELIGHGYDVRIYDPNIRPDRLIGSNREYIERMVPHFRPLLASSPEEVLEHSEVLVVGHKDPEFEGILSRLRPEQEVVDLVRLVKDVKSLNGRYHGIAW
ncbi:MAG: UDP-glucose/GDP-mannose dehydrogenase family protein [Calditrichaeota bacterium]|nr:UDP-glucose/GDP-mannose dehydrogenase family protein [Calditrichota bacterium]